MKNKIAIALAVASGLIATGCQPSTTSETSNSPAATTSAANNEGLKIGSLLPLTGDLATIGQQMAEAAPLLVEKVNACGGVNGQNVTLISQDDQTDPVAGTTAMTKLAEVDRVAGVVGSYASSVSGAAIGVAARNQVVLVSPGSTSPVFTERAKKGEFKGFWARTAPPDTYQALAL